ncbi:serine/threonine-protein phosphatase Pgam5, mitochondrial isoform X1 [Drosophila pseudoobscura]|uniref:Serine/threonine-protein phosphatase Pgam5, mitochondrial n=2 Tax=Drosophila pseudoobscura pseudoobscura TaxID=46245 RepID=PGAM5_DROPS|nr:serine/threonine-protein phosphatase Pgam5, mitochondrial isoform X1 [Drosophila pseudoobscura]Q29HG0.1 RecName: Full=Serine/threonine-protein phosphatase Pgam5, mitochondrial; AltName: Full=Phosphoglycerate mutase family member 5 homolog [Drosophila pseudoobscura pseudoobscura]
MRKFTAFACGTGAGLLTFYLTKLNEPKAAVHNSWTRSEKPVDPCALWDHNWDLRDPKSLVKPVKNDLSQEQNRYNSELEKVVPKHARHIILIRHGEYLDVGDTDETHHLTERGREQAKYTGKRLCELGIKWDKVIASTMVRAQETADIILNEIDYEKAKVKNCAFLREGAPIPPQPPVGHWKPEASQFFRDGARIEAAFRRYFYRAYPDQTKDSYTLLVGHGNVIRYFVCRALQFPPEAWLRISINHASITWLTISPSGNVSIKYLGDTGFMPVNHLTNRIPRAAKNVV